MRIDEAPARLALPEARPNARASLAASGSGDNDLPAAPPAAQSLPLNNNSRPRLRHSASASFLGSGSAGGDAAAAAAAKTVNIKKATVENMGLLNMLTQTDGLSKIESSAAEILGLGPAYSIDFAKEGVVKPAIVHFFGRLAVALLRRVQAFRQGRRIGWRTSSRGALGDEDETEDEDLDEDDDEGTEVASEADAQALLQSLEERLSQGHAFATLASLLMMHTFALRDQRIESLIGASVPPTIRKILMVELTSSVDTLWEQFGGILLERFGCYEAGFQHLDADQSGFIDRKEFVQAYVGLHLEKLYAGDPTILSELLEKPLSKRKSRQLASSRIASPGADEGRSTTSRRSTSATRAGPTMQETFAGRPGGAGNIVQRSNIFGQRGTTARDVARMNKVILRNEASFMFDIVHFGERGLTQVESDSEEDEETTITMPHLIMRLTGVGQRTMESLREWMAQRA